MIRLYNEELKSDSNYSPSLLHFWFPLCYLARIIELYLLVLYSIQNKNVTSALAKWNEKCRTLLDCHAKNYSNGLQPATVVHRCFFTTVFI